MGKSFAKGPLVLLVTLLVGFGLMELGLRLLMSFPLTTRSNQVEHSQLLRTLSPSYSGIDRHGFRNPEDLQASIAAIGDSHTYGVNAFDTQTWPAHLGRLSDRGVYNFGVQGYNIYQYLVLFEMALERGFEDIIVAVYPANDVNPGSTCSTLELSYWQDRLAASELHLPKCARRRTGDRGEAEEKQPAPFWDRILAHARLREHPEVRTFLRRIALVSAFEHLVWDPYLHVWLMGDDKAHTRDYGRFEKEDLEEIRREVSLKDAIIRANLANFRTIMKTMKRRADEQGVGFGVLLIPSKYRVYWEYGRQKDDQLPDLVDRAMRAEDELAQRMERILAQLEVPTRDVTPVLVNRVGPSLDGGPRLYPPNDTHPKGYGYRIYAEAAMPLLR